MIVEVNHPIYGKTELNVARVIGICPHKNWVLFEQVYWPLNEADFIKVAQAWRELYSDQLFKNLKFIHMKRKVFNLMKKVARSYYEAAKMMYPTGVLPMRRF